MEKRPINKKETQQKRRKRRKTYGTDSLKKKETYRYGKETYK